MAGLDKHTPIPTEIKLHQQSRLLEIAFNNGKVFKLPYEFLRVFSPSAAVRGHGAGQEVLQSGKRNVELAELIPVGNYAVQPRFSDGHETGIFSWDLLYSLGEHHDELWQEYLVRLAAAGANRDVDTTPSKTSHTAPGKGGGCGHSK